MRNSTQTFLTLAFAVLLPGLPAGSASAQATTAVERMAAWEAHLALDAESPFQELAWRAVGPKQAGARVEAIAVPSDEEQPGK